MAFPYFYLGLALGGFTLIGASYLRHRFDFERNKQLSYAYLTTGWGLYIVTTILFEGLFGFELLPNVSDKLGGLMMFPALVLIVLGGITFILTFRTVSAPNPER